MELISGEWLYVLIACSYAPIKNNKFPAHKWIYGSFGFNEIYVYKSLNAEVLSPNKVKILALLR